MGDQKCTQKLVLENLKRPSLIKKYNFKTLFMKQGERVQNEFSLLEIGSNGKAMNFWDTHQMRIS